MDAPWGNPRVFRLRALVSTLILAAVTSLHWPLKAADGLPEKNPGDQAVASQEGSFKGEQLKVFQVNQRFYEALSSQRIKAMERVWLPEAWVTCVHPGWEVLTGWKKVRKSWATIFRNTQHLKIKATRVAIQTSGHYAWVSCTENIESYQNANFSRSKAQATNLFQRVKGKWYMVHHHASPITVRMAEAFRGTWATAGAVAGLRC